MLNRVIHSLPMGAIALSVFFFTCDRLEAVPLSNYQEDLGQVTNVNQLRDVSPTDWAYEALRSLVDRYGCIVGFPNQTYGGNQALSRYQFAAGLNSCLNQIERLIATSESLIREDLETLERLIREFEAELATLGGRIDNLESRITFLEDNSFSTTTKLRGEIHNYLLGTFGDKKPNGEDIDDQITFSSRVRLFFDSSFTGQDQLRIRLQAANIVSPAKSGGNNALSLNFEGNNENNVEVNQVFYAFPINSKIKGFIGTVGIDIDDIFDAGSTMGLAYDALSLYSAYNNLLYDNANAFGAAVGANFNFNWATLDVGYWATNPSDPKAGKGLFNGNYTAGANLNFFLFDERWNIAVAYLRAYQDKGSNYDLAGFVGTDAATDPFSDRSNSSNNYSIATKFNVTNTISLGGYFGYTTASVEQGNANADILTWNAYATFSDLLQERGSFIVSFGQPPSLTDSGGDALEKDPDSPYILNLEYQYNLNDNILLTPGGYILFNPNGDSDNNTIYVGTVRTTLRF